MKKLVFPTIFVLTMLMLLTVGCGRNDEGGQAGTEVSVPGVTDTTITLGAILDITGPVASTGEPYLAGIKNYIQFVNDNGGINGRQIILQVEDDEYQVDKALNAYRKLKDEGIFAILGQIGSSIFGALEPEINEEQIVLFGPIQATQQQANNPFTFNMATGSGTEIDIAVQHILASHQGSDIPKVAFFATDNAAAIEYAMALENKAAGGDFEIVLDERIPSGDSDLTSQIMRLKQSGADFVIKSSTTSHFISYLRDAHRLGASDIPVLGGKIGVSATIAESVGREAYENFLAMHAYSPYDGEGPGLEELREVAESYNVNPNVLRDLSYVQGWTTAKVFVEALERTGRDLTRDRFLQQIESITNFDTGGLSPAISFGPNDHEGVTAARFYRYDFESKSIVPQTDYYQAQTQ